MLEYDYSIWAPVKAQKVTKCRVSEMFVQERDGMTDFFRWDEVPGESATDLRARVLASVAEVIQETLGVELDEVTEDARLVEDLAAASIDFLDAKFRLERVFGKLETKEVGEWMETWVTVTVFYETNYQALDHASSKKLREKPELLVAVITAIEDLGFRRLAFRDQGSSTFAFEGVKDDRNNGQFVLITPGNEDFIPHPMMLPAIAKETIVQGDDKIFVRVMPEVNTKDITDEHVLQLSTLIKKSGLRPLLGGQGEDIRKDNVGLYTYINKEGEQVTLPMILDWGSVLWPGESKNGQNTPSPEKIAEFLQKWAEMPELAPWREAQETFPKQAQNVYKDEQLSNLPPQMTLVKAMRDGLYPQEISVLSKIAVDVTLMESDALLELSKASPHQNDMLGILTQVAANAALKGNSDYHQLLRILVQQYDKSQSPDMLASLSERCSTKVL